VEELVGEGISPIRVVDKTPLSHKEVQMRRNPPKKLDGQPATASELEFKLIETQ